MLESKQMKAHVQDGQVVLDEPLDFPEGARLRVVLEDAEDVRDPDIEAAWLKEAKDRFDAHDAGQMKSVPWAEARERIFAKP